MGDEDEKERAGRWGQGSRDKSASLLHRKRQRKRKKEAGEALETGEVSGGGWVGSMNLQPQDQNGYRADVSDWGSEDGCCGCVSILVWQTNGQHWNKWRTMTVEIDAAMACWLWLLVIDGDAVREMGELGN
jgi:hypothetical protein